MKNARVFLMVVLLAWCSGCHRARLTPQAATVAKDQSTRLEAPSQPLSAFSNFELKPMELSAEVAEREEKVAVARRLDDRLRARLSGLIDLWKLEGSSPRTGGTLLIQPKVRSLRVTSSRARMWRGGLGGPFAYGGGSLIVMDLELTDGGTGAIIANPTISKVTGPDRSRGATDLNLLDYIAETAYQYLADNYKNKPGETERKQGGT